MRTEDDLEPRPDAYLQDGTGAGTGSGPRPAPVAQPSPPVLVVAPDPDDPAVTPRGREREEARRRTAQLMDRVADATPEQRREIRDEVVTLHLWLAASATRRFGYRGEYDDLLQVARSGLVEAFDRYDPAQTSYAYFAWVTMNGLLRRHLRDHGWSVRPPRSVQEAANVLRQVTPDLAQELGRAPSAADLATHLEWTVPAVQAARTAELGLHTASLDALVGETWATEHQPEWGQVEARVILHAAVPQLTPAERELLRMRFVEELTQAQIGERLGVTQMQISRLLARLMTKLRGLIGSLDGRPLDRAAS